MNARLATMARKLKDLEISKVNEVGSEEHREVSCDVCDTKEHDTMSFPVIPCIKKVLHGQVNAIGNPYSIPITRGGEIIQILDGAMMGLQIPNHIKEVFTVINLIKHLLHHHNHSIISFHQLHHSRLHLSHSNNHLRPNPTYINPPIKECLRIPSNNSCKIKRIIQNLKSLKRHLMTLRVSWLFSHKPWPLLRRVNYLHNLNQTHLGMCIPLRFKTNHLLAMSKSKPSLFWEVAKLLTRPSGLVVQLR